ncbi:RNA polymerase recycling motor HelD [Clostridium hydrogeniformans]|uniref:RNA polymerase recycling motor HelD n=1 Tax=Clostridium hydrogeniformans TaxID=349933 RepID=UPI00047FB678|nr:RNA polymerase recycling motor HelD [Clostridium hydrogeniformans]
MSVLDHPDYNKEVEKLNYTLEYMKIYNKRVFEEKLRVDEDVEYGLKHYNSDNAEQFNELIINKVIKDSLNQRLKNLNKSLSKPYFSRVDFIEKEGNRLEELYIGKVSLLRETDQELIIVDWRAPIATLYYEGRIGEASFESPSGAIQGEIKLKRQYTIEKSELKEIHDIDITTNDEFLQAALGSSKDKRLKDIVSTIQAEQNRVIRADMWKPLVVQGAAGGGKTTIALHRIAYLLYNHEKTLSPKNFMIIAPNRFFLNYISEVLPDLGVENVVQTTFEDFALEVIGKKFKIENTSEKLSFLINNNSMDRKHKVENISSFKSSFKFKKILDKYIKIIEKNFIPKEDFKIESFLLLKYEEINDLFIKDYSYLPMKERINEIKKNLTNILKQNKDRIIEDIEHTYDRKIEKVKEKMDDCVERRSIIINLADTRDLMLTKVKKTYKSVIREYIKKILVLSPMEYYKKLLEDKLLFKELSYEYVEETIAEEIRLETLKNIKSNTIEVEDLAPLMYLKVVVNGLDDRINVRHVVIDEAQDFSVFQLIVLKKIIGGNSFTVLGDLCQGIYSYRGINHWEEASRLVFGEDNFSMVTLKQSYRTTIEIMKAANIVIKSLNDPSLIEAEPVIRHGEEVKVVEKYNFKDIIECIKNDISNIQVDGFKSAAIICKTVEECIEFKKELKKLGIDIKIINEGENEYSGGMVLIPCHLAKGLEFDVVIIANGSKKMYPKTELNVKLLYIAMTRPIHKLYIYSLGEMAEMLKLI